MGIKIYSPTAAGRFIDRRLARIEGNGFFGREAMARLVRQNNIAASFGGGTTAISPAIEVSSVGLAEQIGIKLIAIPAGEFIYQGGRIQGKSYKIAETELTNRQFRKLWKVKPEELAKIVADPRARLANSLSVVDPDYEHEAEDCPMVFLDKRASDGIANLLGIRLPTEQEWERAAAGTDGRQYSFGEEFDRNKATLNGKGTRSVYAHRDAATPEGVLDLSGNVWEWTISNEGSCRALRGGSWSNNNHGSLQAAYRLISHPDLRNYAIGFRFAED